MWFTIKIFKNILIGMYVKDNFWATPLGEKIICKCHWKYK